MSEERLRSLLRDGSLIAALFTLACLLAGCAGCNEVEAGCRTDDDCRAGRICSDSVCTDPDIVLNNDQPDAGNNDPSDASNNGADFNNGLNNGIDAANNVPGDMSIPDASPEDSGPLDSGMPDIGTPDTGPADTGTPDTGTPDTGPADTGTPDTGMPDMGSPDTGTPDLGTGTPQIRVTPATEIDFGLVILGDTISTPLLVENVGDGDLVITSLDLRSRPSQGFDVMPVVDAAGPVTIPPGGSEAYSVTFAPTVQGFYDNDIDIVSNDPVDPTYPVDLSGRGRSPTNNASCLSAAPDVLDFGTVDPGMTRERTVTMTNCGPSDVTITGYEIVNDPNGPFSFTPAVVPPDTLAPGDSVDVDVTFAPSNYQDAADEFRIRSDAQLGTQIDVDLIGTGGGCAAAVALAESASDPTDEPRAGRVPVVTNTTAQLDGSESSSPSGSLDYTWMITSSPQGSNASLTSPSVQSPSLTPDVPGTYVVELAVTDPATGRAGCVTDSVEIVALDGLPALRVDASWAADHDMDLHLLRSDANGDFPAFGDMLDDVHYDNLAPDWNMLNVGTDDPFHYGDDTDGFGPETIILAELEPGRTYQVALQFSNPDGFRPFDWNANATLTVQSSSGVPMVQNRTRQFDRQEAGLYWIIWEVDGTTGAVTTIDTTEN